MKGLVTLLAWLVAGCSIQGINQPPEQCWRVEVAEWEPVEGSLPAAEEPTFGKFLDIVPDLVELVGGEIKGMLAAIVPVSFTQGVKEVAETVENGNLRLIRAQGPVPEGCDEYVLKIISTSQKTEVELSAQDQRNPIQRE